MAYHHCHRYCIAIALLCAPTSIVNAQVIVSGDIYTSNYSSQIRHYTTSGVQIGTITIPTVYGTQVKGMAYGPDGLMYATVGKIGGGYNVVALNSAGSVVQTYSGPDNVTGNLSFGKLVFGLNNQFFVGGAGSLRRFTIGSATHTQVFSAGSIFDATLLPSGNLLVLGPNNLYEMTPSGAIVREIIPSVSLVDGRGVAYNPSTNDIYVTMLGDSSQMFSLMRLDGTTGNLEKSVFFLYADDMFLTTDYRLLVGSRLESVGIFNLDLNQIGSLSGDDQLFVTQLVVPEPSSMILLGMVASAIGLRHFKKARILRSDSAPQTV